MSYISYKSFKVKNAFLATSAIHKYAYSDGISETQDDKKHKSLFTPFILLQKTMPYSDLFWV